jgi:hypothetical protein
VETTQITIFFKIVSIFFFFKFFFLKTFSLWVFVQVLIFNTLTLNFETQVLILTCDMFSFFHRL